MSTSCSPKTVVVCGSSFHWLSSPYGSLGKETNQSQSICFYIGVNSLDEVNESEQHRERYQELLQCAAKNALLAAGTHSLSWESVGYWSRGGSKGS